MRNYLLINVLILASIYSCGKKVVNHDYKVDKKTSVEVKGLPGTATIIKRHGQPQNGEKALLDTILIDTKNNKVFQYTTYGWLQIGQTDKELKIDVENVEALSDVETPKLDTLYYVVPRKKAYIHDGEQFVERIDASIIQKQTVNRQIVIEGVLKPTGDMGDNGDFYIDTSLEKSYQKDSGQWVQIGLDETKNRSCGQMIVGKSKELTEIGDVCVDENNKIYKKEKAGWIQLKGIRIVQTNDVHQEKSLDENTIYIDENKKDGFIYQDGKLTQIFKQDVDYANHLISRPGLPVNSIGFDGDMYKNTDDESLYIKEDSKWLSINTEKTIVKTIIKTIEKQIEEEGRIEKVDYIITAEGHSDSDENLSDYILPYFSQRSVNGKKLTIENLVNTQTNAKSEDLNVNKNAQVIFRFNFNKIKEALKVDMKISKITVNLKFNRSNLDNNGSTEIFCFLNIGRCSGQPFFKKSKFGFLLNPNFFKKTQHPHVNNLFIERLRNDELKTVRNDHSKKLKVVKHLLDFELDEIFEVQKEDIIKIIKKDGILTFVLADDLALERLPSITIELEKENEL